MPQNTTITGPANTWVLGTDANVTEIRFQNIGSGILYAQGTVGAVPPTSTLGAIKYEPGDGQVRTPLVDMFEGVTGANRVYFYSDVDFAVSVSHA
jgi:hypothetical protein